MRSTRLPRLSRRVQLLVYLGVWDAAVWGLFAITKRGDVGLPSTVAAACVSEAIACALIVQAGTSAVSKVAVAAVVIAGLTASIAIFAGVYMQFGTAANFGHALSHLDAIYFATGTLTTVGTGNLSAATEAARAIQLGQMVVDFAIVIFGVGLALASLSRQS